MAADGRFDTHPVALDNLALVLGSKGSIHADHGMRWENWGKEGGQASPGQAGKRAMIEALDFAAHKLNVAPAPPSSAATSSP